ncbi:YoaK family protein [Streptomyces sp. NPDC049577]|uniref:YoaK family protein n=1 Tax=Streptomyces sp. NPDC049577 TaxID=3155153 RepID=UPI00341487E3
MRDPLRRVAEWLFPGSSPEADEARGTLPVPLVLLTVVTGVVDAVSFLGPSHVFVANMTGNIVFLGFALAGSRIHTAWASLLSLGAFCVGAWTTGRLVRRLNRPRSLFAVVTAVHTALVAAALASALAQGARGTSAEASLLALLACGMGLQNGVVLAVAVPDLVTTALTRTVTGLIMDVPGAATVRRTVSVVAMFTGALCGGVLCLGTGPAAALALAVALTLLATVTAAAEPALRG